MSFKLKLVAYFVLLALLPLAAAFVGFGAVAQRSEMRLADARLEAGLRASVAAYRAELAQAQRAAGAVARSRVFQRALAERDSRTLGRILGGSPNLRVETADGFRVGSVVPNAAEREVVVVGPQGVDAELGVVVASVPFDAALAERLRASSGLPDDGGVLLVRGGTIVAGSDALGGPYRLAPGRPGRVSVGGATYRGLAAGTANGDGGVSLAVLVPQEAIDNASRRVQLQLLVALGASLLLVAIVAYLEGRSIVRTLKRLVAAANRFAQGRLDERVEVSGRDEFADLGRSFNDMAEQLQARVGELETERRRLREATLRFGEALAATHDEEQLLRKIVETAVESTGATGGEIVGSRGAHVQAGRPAPGDARFELPLAVGRESFGTLVLRGPEFSIQDLETAALLVGHAAVALENARLHRMVEQQALVDGLTGLANRRHAEDTLAATLARVDRGGGSVALVFADLDAFKDVNDRHGHPAGDAVLCEFAAVLGDSVREMDLAARWGGEEFAIILPDTDAAGAAAFAERTRLALAERPLLTPAGVPLRLTASFGVATYPPATSQRELVAHADGALYDAKRGGKNRVATAAEAAHRA
ncbi:MAG TPA: diguanylate cyclase [Gaiellaceae bacterium]|nr:diguanylate cyclase [Gaiellaceae bacterium]